jgi:hypothetical protein
MYNRGGNSWGGGWKKGEVKAPIETKRSRR